MKMPLHVLFFRLFSIYRSFQFEKIYIHCIYIFKSQVKSIEKDQCRKYLLRKQLFIGYVEVVYEIHKLK